MSDTEGTRPTDSHEPHADAVEGAPAATTPSPEHEPTSSTSPVSPTPPAESVLPPRPPMPDAQAQPAAPTAATPAPDAPTAAASTAPSAASAPRGAVPAYPGAPQHPGAPAYPVAPPYAGAPRGYAQAPQQQYAGAPAYGAAFGAAAHNQTQPTLPLAGGVGEPVSPVKTKSTTGAGKVAALIIAAALVGGAAGLGTSFAGASIWGTTQTVTATGPAAVTVNNTDSVNQTTGIAAKVVPSVVTISATSSSAGGTGSGVILSADGYVVTNTHVVTLDGATSDATLSVTTSDGKVYAAEIVGTDPTYDLAVIKLVDAEGLTPIEFADSSSLNVGDVTVAVGAPLGLSNTVTTGIISALNRSISIASSAAPESSDSTETPEQTPEGGQEGPFYFDFGQGQDQSQQSATSTISIAVLQTDAAINPGNSGGALVDAEGKLIGINVAIATAGSSSESGSIGVGFSIPSSIVERITKEIIDDGAATHGLLGAMVGDAANVEGATTTGAYISGVTDGGAAQSAGLREGDIVTGLDGTPITDATDLTAQVRAAAAGSTVTLTYVRDGKTATTDATLGALTQ